MVNLSKVSDVFSINTDLAWYDNVTARSHNDKDETLKYLPRVQFGSTLMPLADSSLLASFGGNYTGLLQY